MSIHKRLARLLLIASLLLGGSACSNLQIAYNYADTFSLYYLDSYLDLTAEQERQAAAGLQSLFAWHRQNELPAYARELAGAQQFMLGQLTLEQLAGMNAFMRASLERTALQATPMLSELLLSLNPAQVSYLRTQLEQSNADFRAEYLAGDERQRRYQLLLEQFEDWFGELDAQQLALLRVASADWPVDSRFWYAERLIRQQEMLALVDYAVAQQPSRELLQARLQQYIRGFERDRSAQRQARIDQSREHAMRLIVALTAQGTSEQKRAAVARAQGLIDDFGVLLAER
ncbi:DUF6279 family lipoprotein [Pseudomonas sp. N040]|uniref:DUF6279 family lipoprotein n=1 Tax=Pseudomonas sp. N040 TaxID=2785325 RepID=UPI0018A2FE99|nr:DUF6279 family lipoprotein [Pseudomonas sp. N040]MBF7729446.1 hypothetical protein [Pseudomonas sp. N040]MBW7013086.1 hypothetical protein [Pseudomonas sp. N040]